LCDGLVMRIAISTELTLSLPGEACFGAGCGKAA
jgi:hypothetical protein